jgi:hypothetical protein
MVLITSLHNRSSISFVKKRIFRLAAIVSISATIAGPVPAAFAANPRDTREYLERFHRDPNRVMNEPLVKIDDHGAVIADQTPSLKKPSRLRKKLVQAKDLQRQAICAQAGRNCDAKRPARATQTFAAMNSENRVKSFLYETSYMTKPLEMEQAGLLQSALPEPPWSDSYWPVTKGLIARRWADQGFPDSNDWLTNFNYVQSAPAVTGNPDTLSPAEKYDMLVGDDGFSLTTKMWSEGQYYQEKDGKVLLWMGLCHGWAPASIMTLVPKKSVVVTTPQGREIVFYPSDIKALASQLWGEAPPMYKFVGSRCKVTEPKEDAVGRVIDDGCFDVNPATWHIGIVNQLGAQKRGFVFDATYDQQVWNYPIYSYQYRYFNPQTLAVSQKLAGSVVDVADFSIDKFKTFRAPGTRYVVGIAMDVRYAVPTKPSVKAVTKSTFHTVKYVYDLELDASGAIIGGEWYSNFHPDFMWNPPPDGRALSAGEKKMKSVPFWGGSGPVPPPLQEAARISSTKGQPVAAVVDALIRLSQ